MTGRLEPKESTAWQQRAFCYLVSFPIIALCMALVFIVMFAMLQLQVKLFRFIRLFSLYRFMLFVVAFNNYVNHFFSESHFLESIALLFLH